MKVLRKAGVTQQEATVWSRWLAAGEQIATDFRAWEDDPFAYNETASVGVLAAAAVKAGLLALPEYVAKKADKLDRRKRVNGRCDLWIASNRLCWAFEFKNMILGAPPRGQTLEDRLEAAVTCASEVTATEADARVGCLIVSTFWAETAAKQEALRAKLDGFKTNSDFAAVIEPNNDHAAATYFFIRHHRGT